jgi:hypothetical protein
MDTFALDPRQWRMVRVFSTNPLVRYTDRIEVLAVMLALVASLVTVPVADVVATTVYEARHQVYAEQARERHPLTEATALPQTTNGGQAGGPRMTGAPAEAAGGAGFSSTSNAATDALDQIWVDDTGNGVPPPTPLSRAQYDAVSVAVSIVAGAVVMTTALVRATRWRLDRARNAQWDRELANIVDEDDRTNGAGYGRTL